MWKYKQPKICNIYFRFSNHVIITKRRILSQYQAQVGKTTKCHTNHSCNRFCIYFENIYGEISHHYPPTIELILVCTWTFFSLRSYNFLDLLVEMFWVVLISYIGSLKLSNDSIEGDRLVNLGSNMVNLASNFSKKKKMEVSFLYHLLDVDCNGRY